MLQDILSILKKCCYFELSIHLNIIAHQFWAAYVFRIDKNNKKSFLSTKWVLKDHVTLNTGEMAAYEFILYQFISSHLNPAQQANWFFLYSDSLNLAVSPNISKRGFRAFWLSQHSLPFVNHCRRKHSTFHSRWCKLYTDVYIETDHPPDVQYTT